MRKSILIILILFGISLVGFSQVFPLLPKYYQPLDSSVLAKNNREDDSRKSILMQRHETISYSVTLGTGYSNFGNDMSIMNSYIAPSVSYWASSKLNFTVTGIIMQNNMSGMEAFYGVEPGYSMNQNMSNYGISGSAYYQLSEKWSVWGDGMYMEDQQIFSNSSQQLYNTDFKTASVGVAFKSSDNFQFNVQFRYTDGLNPAYNFNSPFYNPGANPFRSNFGIWAY